MKRLLMIALVAFACVASNAHAGSIGVGAFGGVSVPVLQEDQAQGSLLGIRVPVKLVPLFTAEPFYSKGKLSDKTVTIGGLDFTREGFDVTTYGLNAMLTLGGPISFYPYAGIGKAKFERTGQNESWTSYSLGLGLSLSPIPKVSVDLRGELQAAVDGDVSRKMVNVTLGASYSLFSMP